MLTQSAQHHQEVPEVAAMQLCMPARACTGHGRLCWPVRVVQVRVRQHLLEARSHWRRQRLAATETWRSLVHARISGS